MIFITPEENELRLIETDGHQAPYVTLSHRWGTKRPLITTAANYKKHLDRISPDEVPPLFRDAIHTVRRLGFQYMWIDSLCIIQDSTDDWQQECAKMAKIYEHSALTIAGPDCEDSSEGFVNTRRAPIHGPCIIDFRTGDQWGISGRVMLSYREVHNIHVRYPISSSGFRPFEPPMSTRLAKRAWIVQERILSPRVLYFAAERMWWECNTHSRFECLHYPLENGSLNNKSPERIAPHKVSLTSFTTLDDEYDYWYRIVTAYSSCALTKPGDKLPALSGLASRMRKRTGDVYLAGLWRTDLGRGLLWNVRSFFDGSVYVNNSSRAPSWSWASLDLEVEWKILPVKRYNHNAMDFRVLGASAEPAGLDPFGQVRVPSALLRLKARIKTRSVRIIGQSREYGIFMEEDDQKLDSYEDSHLLGFSNRLGFSLLLDDRDRFVERSQGNWEVIVVSFLCVAMRVEEGAHLHKPSALAIERVPDSANRFRRFGIARDMPAGWFDKDYELREIELV